MQKKRTKANVEWPRKIIHIDMDAFFAAIEQRDNPALRGKPVIVGGDPKSRGVVSTCSYEARPYGVHSAMASAVAFRLCPQAIFVRPRMQVYQAASRQIHSILHQHTDLVESASLDEAYLDVTRHKLSIEDPVMIARLIKQNIHAATRLTASAGVATSLFLAKIGSDFKKPDGLTVIPPGTEAEFLENLPVRKIPGVGPVTEAQLHRLGFFTCGDLAAASPGKLEKSLGSWGPALRQRARGIDDRQVEPWTEPKQSSVEETFEKDTVNIPFLKAKLREFSEAVFEDLKRHELMGFTVVLKVKYHDFELITRSQTLRREPGSPNDLYEAGVKLLQAKTRAGRKPIRLIGLGVSGLRSLREIRMTTTPDLFSGVSFS